jgi:cytochrome c553
MPLAAGIRSMKPFAAAIVLSTMWMPAAIAGDAAGDAMLKVTTTCQSCHGLTGDSSSPKIPRLNGQQADYIAARLKSFLDPTRQTPAATHAMWDIASHIGDDIVPDIAKYYAQQAPTPPAAKKGKLAATGKSIYERGVGSSVPACQSCHGAHGEGIGAVPRIAGQHGEYLTMQLLSFNVTLRYHETMDHNAMYLSEEQIAALVAYLGNN